MLTRLRIEGFKNLLDVDLRFGPFTCIAGLNGAGKSNAFDAIRFLHLLAEHPIMEAVQLLRETKGRSLEPRSLFTAFGDFTAPKIKLTADLLIEQRAEDDFGIEVEAAISTVRYSVGFKLDSSERRERLELAEEELVPIALATARREIGFPASGEFLDSAIRGRRAKPFISTRAGDGGHQIRVHQEGHGGRQLPAPTSFRTVLNGVASSEFPTLLAVQREMASWRNLLLEPSAMRSPSLYDDPVRVDARGGNLPAALERLRKSESRAGEVYARVENRLADLIDDVREVRVADDGIETLTLQIKGADGVFHSARSLSDGTLRFLVLSALAIDSEARGVVCLEEPENGIHPGRIAAMVDLLRDMACDTKFPVADDNPMRQVLINTHSPAVIDEVGAEDLIFVRDRRLRLNGSSGDVAEVLVPPNVWRSSVARPSALIARGDLLPYFSVPGRLLGQLYLPLGR